MKWTGFADDYGIIKGFFRLNQARNFSDYEDAMEVYSYPGQNFIYADVYGNIALYPTANYPVRNATGTVKQGRYILNGSNGQDEWTGYIPFEWIPHKVNPDQMYLASANQRTVNTTEYTEYYTSYAFAESYRARRINQLLENASKYGYTIDIEKMKEIQTDYYDIAAEVFVPYLLQAFDDKYPTGVNNTGTTELLNKSIESLRSWNKSNSRWIMDKDLIAPAIFDTWLNDYRECTFNDEITDANLSISGMMVRVLTDFLENITRYNQNSLWFNDTSTSNTENASIIMLKALNNTISYLNTKLGDFDDWQWGNMHKMDIKYLMGMVSLPDFDFPQYACSGSSRTINVRSGEYVHSGSSMRMIVDFQMLSNKSLYSGYLTLPGGQSGNPLSSHYSDNHELWKNDEYHPILFPTNISEYPTSEIYSTVVFS
jgi:penicillin amidase